jgi:hypothetical protein
VALMRWVIAIEKATIGDGSGGFPPCSVILGLQLDEGLAAEISAYASADVLAREQELLWWLRRATLWAGDERIEAFPAAPRKVYTQPARLPTLPSSW